MKLMKREKQGIDFKYLAKKALSELAIATLLGALPVAIYATNPKALDSITGGLLASGELINHAGYLIYLYMAATAIRYGMRFTSETIQERFVAFHNLTAEIGTSFITIIRTGLGAMIGVLVLALTTDIIILDRSDYAGLAAYILIVSIVSTGLAVLHEILAVVSKKPKYENDLRFDTRLKR
ncbi:hypothetical protein [Pseudomonas brassicacearum]|uniref:Uncharacterized protein n=2 Tax=Pseudomonas TaxID=286 RepID=A0AAJ3KXI7_9PSED|nr:hypothetical protein [Pseudomonas brassicacearum]NUT82430.1 hypothetical protein [Pseudomonas brassicacearum]